MCGGDKRVIALFPNVLI